jgi:hypothetical protein
MKKTQKFFKGDLVMVGEMPNSMSHFPHSCEAIVIRSGEEYNDHIGSDRYTLYILKKGHRGEHSWYNEDQLTLIESNQFDLLPKSHVDRRVYEAKIDRDQYVYRWM